MAHYYLEETADGLDFGVVCCLHYPAAWAISKPDVKQVKKEKKCSGVYYSFLLGGSSLSPSFVLASSKQINLQQLKLHCGG